MTYLANCYSCSPPVSFNTARYNSAASIPSYTRPDISISMPDYAGSWFSKFYAQKDYVTRTARYVPTIQNDFLSRERSPAIFVSSIEGIEEDVKKAFFETTGLIFPNDISISILDEKNFKAALKHFGGIFTDGLLGFSIQPGTIIVKNDELDRLMLTIGHEIGHLMSPTKKDNVLEEAKAFAFEIAWLKAIKDHNIAGLSSSLMMPNPAKNNVHDKGLEFVIERIESGKRPLEIFSQISFCIQ